MKLGDILNNLATLAGKQDDKALIDLLSNSAIANTDISEDLAKSLTENLMTAESAKNNYGLKNHYSAQILNAVDARLLNDLDLDEETLLAIQAEKNSYNKIDLVKSALKKQIDALKSGDPADKNKKTEVENQIKELNALLASEKEVNAKALSDLSSKHENEIKEFILTNRLTGKNFANKDWSINDNVSFSKTLIENALKEKGIVIVKDGNELKLKQANAPELDYYQENKPISFNDFTDQVLSSKKMLAVNNSGATQTPNTTTTPVHVNSGGTQQNTKGFDSAMEQALGVQNNE